MRRQIIENYAKWTDTVALYPVTAEPYYLALGIANEAGEFEAAAQDHMIDEAGDVFWYAARYARKVLRVPFADICADAERRIRTGALSMSVLGAAATICAVEKKRIRDGEHWDAAVAARKRIDAMHALMSLVARVMMRLNAQGSCIYSALRANEEKLTQRFAAHTIRGDGDNR